MGNRHGRDGNCLLHRPLWRAFSYSSFSLKAATGGAEVPAWHAAFDASAALCWKGSMGEDGKAVWTLSEATVGWTNETEGGRGLTATVPGVRLHLPPSLLLLLLLWFLLTKLNRGHLLTGGWFIFFHFQPCYEHVGGLATAMDYPWLCDWSYQWAQLSPGPPVGPLPVNAVQTSTCIYGTPTREDSSFYYNRLIFIWISSSHLEILKRIFQIFWLIVWRLFVFLMLSAFDTGW